MGEKEERVLGAGRRGESRVSFTGRLEELLHHFVFEGEGANYRFCHPGWRSPALL